MPKDVAIVGIVASALGADMFMTKAAAIALSTLLLAAGSFAFVPKSNAHPETEEASRQPGSTEVLRSPLSLAEDLEVIVSDVIIPPNQGLPPHYHPGEEFIYLIEGSAIHVEEDQPERLVQAGESLVIAPGEVHAPRGGEEGARAIVFRVHRAGEPERILVEE